MGGLIWTRSLTGVLIGATLAGLGFSAVYPITISLLSRQFGAAATRIGSIMFVMAYLGGASLPWLVGYASTATGSLKAGLMVPLVAGAIILLLYFTPWKPIQNDTAAG
jgi:fucose permease